MDYRSLHWGVRSTHDECMSWLSGCRCAPVCELRAIVYATLKGGDDVREERDYLYRHAFLRHGGRRARLLRADDRGSIELPAVSERLLALGRVLYFESDSGAKIFTPFLWLCTTSDNPGRPVLASRFKPDIALEVVEYRGESVPFVSEHGLER